MVKRDNLKKELKNNYLWENLSVLSKNICLSCLPLSTIQDNCLKLQYDSAKSLPYEYT